MQGAEAPAQIAAMLHAASRSQRYDVLLLTRGGGSLEDLAAFNDEGVARAIVASAVPVVSAVGHEVDFSISDFVADLRAPTPSAAAELILPDGDALARGLELAESRLRQAWNRRAQNATQRLDHLATRLHNQRPQQRLAMQRERMQALRERLLRAQARTHERAAARLGQATAQLLAQHPRTRLGQLGLRNTELQRRLVVACTHRIAREHERAAGLARALNAVSPLDVLKRGYAILFDDTGNVLRTVQHAKPGDALRGRLADGELPLRVMPGNKTE